MARVYRIQDRLGRGPWQPGFSHLWSDPDLPEGWEDLKPWGEEFGFDLLQRRGLPGEHYGCAVRRLRDLTRWVSASECRRLQEFGFSIVSIRPDRILAESKVQLVFACKQPLARAGTIMTWEEMNE